MPPSKKQKTSEESSAPTQEKEPESATPHKSDKEKKGRDPITIPQYEYVCIPRPRIDYFSENSQLGEEALDHHELMDKFVNGFNGEVKSDVMYEPAKDHPEWKWAVLMKSWTTFIDYRRRAKYCDPDNFGMYIHNDFCGKGYMELIENLMLDFDAALKKKEDDALKQMWAPISALVLWLKDIEEFHFINNEDGDKVKALCEIIGFALLRALAALDHAGELKVGTEFLDVPVVITSYLEWSDDLEDCGIDEESIAWRPHAAAYFKKAKFEDDKGIAGGAKFIEEAKPSDEKELPKETDKDPWKWSKRLKDFKKHHGTPKIGGTHYDITKMTRKERASAAFDHKDPLADLADKDLKDGLLDFA